MFGMGSFTYGAPHHLWLIRKEDSLSTELGRKQMLVLRALTGPSKFFRLSSLTSASCGHNTSFPPEETGAPVNYFEGTGTGSFGTSAGSTSPGYKIAFNVGDFGDSATSDNMTADWFAFKVTNGHGVVVFDGRGHFTTGGEEIQENTEPHPPTTTTITTTTPGTTTTITTPGTTTTIPGTTTTVTVTVTTPAPATPAVKTKSCIKPTGHLAGVALGPFSLGNTKTQARHIDPVFKVIGYGYDQFCLYRSIGIRLGYPSNKFLSHLSAAERAAVKGRAVIALTANRRYSLDGVKPGAVLAKVARKLRLGKPFHIGLNDWYLNKGRTANGVVKVRGRIIVEVGTVNKQLTATRNEQKRLLNSFAAL
jgi:hypothetical protein